uniref:hypothetical protein n=1 Tax=Adhaeribacter terrigena TaxID=2793070 RepID=UPI003743025B
MHGKLMQVRVFSGKAYFKSAGFSLNELVQRMSFAVDFDSVFTGNFYFQWFFEGKVVGFYYFQVNWGGLAI